MAFALPGMDVQSELRDVICSDFEFDGTRAGIIDQTITVTFLPSLFGSNQTTPSPNPGASDASRTPRPHAPYSANPVTPHPFADYSVFSRLPGSSAISHPHSPTTPFSMASIWGSRPHTPGQSGLRPLSSTTAHHGPGFSTHTPPSVNGDDFAHDPHYFDADSAGGHLTRPAIPADALQPHWSAQGLGRQTFHGLIWSLFHPRAALRALCSIQLRVMVSGAHAFLGLACFAHPTDTFCLLRADSSLTMQVSLSATKTPGVYVRQSRALFPLPRCVSVLFQRCCST